MGFLWQRVRSEQLVVKNCKYCDGDGYRGRHLCQACGGSGQAKTLYFRPKGWGRRTS